MGWNDLTLSATGSTGANASVTGQTLAGAREADSGTTFEQELRRQAEPDQTEPAKQSSSAAMTAVVEPRPDSQPAEQVAGDSPADWLALLDGMRASAGTSPATTAPAVPATADPVASAPVAPAVVAAPATAGSAHHIQAASSSAPSELKPDRAPAAATDLEETGSVPHDAIDLAQLAPASALELGVMIAPAPQFLPQATEMRAAPPAASLESITDRPGVQSPQALTAQTEPDELGASAARALVAAAADVTSNAPARAEAETGKVDFTALVAPAASSASTGAERLPAEAPVQRHVATPMGQQGWDQAVSQQVSWLVRDQLQNASLSLNPPNLGPVQVQLQLDQQQATVHFVAASPEVRQALEDALPVLRAMLGEAGISLGQADVGSRQPDRGNPAFQRSARRQDAADDEAAAETPVQRRAGGGGLVNLFA